MVDDGGTGEVNRGDPASPAFEIDQQQRTDEVGVFAVEFADRFARVVSFTQVEPKITRPKPGRS